MSVIFSYHALLLCTVGVLSGILSSVPLGPTNFWLAHSVLPPQKTKSEQYCFIAGITLMDVLYALMALWGYYIFLQGTAVSFMLILISAAALIAMGLFDLRKLYYSSKTEPAAVRETSSSINSFLFGVVLGSNPGFLVYWLMVARAIESLGVEMISFTLGLFFSTGLIFADTVWYSFVLKLSRSSVNFLTGSSLRWLRVLLAFSFILFGLGILSDITSLSEAIF